MQAIVNCDNNWGIGKDNKLLFHLPKDMAFFREKTLGKTVVMGKNTFLSLPKKLPLADRENIVLWKGGDKENAKRDGYKIAESLEELFSLLKRYNQDDIFVIGGAFVYEILLPYCSKVYLTRLDADGNADRFFPCLDRLPNWALESVSPVIVDGLLSFRFCVYKNSTVKSFL